MKKFTLVEILVVIAVIGILASLILPAVTGANQQTMRLKAKADVSNIMSAIVKYESTYGKLPILQTTSGSTGYDPQIFDSGSDGNDYGRLSEEGYDALMQILSGVDIDTTMVNNEGVLTGGSSSYWELNNGSGSISDQAKALNPRKTPFLDVPQEFTSQGFLDPWGNRYVIVLDYEIENLPTGSAEYDGTNDVISPYDRIIQHPAIGVANNITAGSGANNPNLRLNGNDIAVPAVVRASVLVYSKGANGTDDGGLDVTVSNEFDDINSWSELQ